MKERDFICAVINGAEELLAMMNGDPSAYMKIARLSGPPRASDKTKGMYRLYLDDYVRDGAEVYPGERRQLIGKLISEYSMT
jgi:hypothetical protein